MAISTDDFFYSATIEDITLAVSMGQAPGYSTVDKFGVNPSIDILTTPEDVWEGGGIYIYDAAGIAPIVSIASDSGSDTVDVVIEGLDIDGNMVTQVITLTGTTRAALTTPLWRVFRMENEGASDLVGTVFCYIGTGTVPSVGDPEIRAIIDNGNNQTLMAMYTIPKGKVGFLYRGEIGMSLDANPASAQNVVKASYRSRRLGQIFKIKKVLTLMLSGDSNYVDKRSFPDIIPSFTDIRMSVDVVTEDGMGVWGTLDILLIDQSKFSREYLIAIGQPGVV